MTEKTAVDYRPASLDELSDALDALVTQLVRYRKLRQWEAQQEKSDGGPSEAFQMVSFSELAKVPADVLRQRSIVEQPVVWALKLGIIEIGKLMYAATGSTDQMVVLVDAVCNRDPKNFSQRISPIDSAFNGIGKGDDRWWS